MHTKKHKRREIKIQTKNNNTNVFELIAKLLHYFRIRAIRFRTRFHRKRCDTNP